MMVLGIDPSIRGTGMCWGDGAGVPHSTKIGAMRPLTPAEERGKSGCRLRMKRLEDLVARVYAIVQEVAPKLILIEGYAFQTKQPQNYTAEFGGVLRWHLIDYTDWVYEVGPLALKKYATGTGGAIRSAETGKKIPTKAAIERAVKKQWKVVLPSADECDAYVLYRMGLTLCGLTEDKLPHHKEVLWKLCPRSEANELTAMALGNTEFVSPTKTEGEGHGQEDGAAGVF